MAVAGPDWPLRSPALRCGLIQLPGIRYTAVSEFWGRYELGLVERAASGEAGFEETTALEMSEVEISSSCEYRTAEISDTENVDSLEQRVAKEESPCEAGIADSAVAKIEVSEKCAGQVNTEDLLRILSRDECQVLSQEPLRGEARLMLRPLKNLIKRCRTCGVQIERGVWGAQEPAYLIDDLLPPLRPLLPETRQRFKPGRSRSRLCKPRHRLGPRRLLRR